MRDTEAIDPILHIGRILHTDQVVLLIRVVPAGLLRHHHLPTTLRLRQVRLREHRIQNLQVVNLQAAVIRLPQMEHHQLRLIRQHRQQLWEKNLTWVIES